MNTIKQISSYEKSFYNSKPCVSTKEEFDNMLAYLRPNIEMLRKHGILGKSFKLLDIGCGNGLFSLALKTIDPTLAVTGVDISENNVECAIENSSKFGADGSFIVSNIFECKEIGKYDVIFCHGFLHHVHKDIKVVVEIIHNLLEERGYFFSIEPNPYSLYQFLAFGIGLFINEYLPNKFTKGMFTVNERPISYKKIIYKEYFELVGYDIGNLDYATGFKKYFVIHHMLPKKFKGNSQILLLRKKAVT
ncbi:MAG: class I SAM-dependent methyltransferase [Nitrospirae bacterium]|nr:class I SAM-dependent methyltransferase [Nitrospirota bacterium]